MLERRIGTSAMSPNCPHEAVSQTTEVFPAGSLARQRHGEEAVNVVAEIYVQANYDSARIDADSGASDICRKTWHEIKRDGRGSIREL